MSHSLCTHQGRVDSRLLVVGSQTRSLTPGPSFCHNLCCKCPNDSCEAIFDIYTSIAFQWYTKCLKARCFDSCNRALKFWESRRTPKSPFRECECHPHTLSKVGLQHFYLFTHPFTYLATYLPIIHPPTYLLLTYLPIYLYIFSYLLTYPPTCILLMSYMSTHQPT